MLFSLKLLQFTPIYLDLLRLASLPLINTPITSKPPKNGIINPMKNQRIITTFSLIFVIGTIFSVVLIFDSVKAVEVPIEGNIWSENIGWVSPNYNDSRFGPPSVDYSVLFDDENRNLAGYMWSDRVGWLCFGQSCVDAGLGSTPAIGGGSIPAVVRESGLIDSWAGWVTLGNDGWTDLLGDQILTGDFSNKVACRNCQGGSCGFCFENDDNNGSGYIYENCSGCSDLSCSLCQNKFQHGVGLDQIKNNLVGWAWNANNLGGSGFGWLHFDEDVEPKPYLQTVDGNVYSRIGINGESAPQGHYNATFMLQSGGSISKFYSEYEYTQNPDWKIENYDQLNLPDAENNYTSSISKIDFPGLYAGQYGEVSIIQNQAGLPSSTPLSGKVYYHQGDLSLYSSQYFRSGSGAVDGSGTVIVNGDLTVESNSFYLDTGLASWKNLPSVGFIVKGDLYISSNVTELSGNFYVEGTVYTGSSANQLVVNGIMVAKDFEFQRSYLQNKEPAEKIIYDKRIFMNIPPGFDDIAKGLPKWQF